MDKVIVRISERRLAGAPRNTMIVRHNTDYTIKFEIDPQSGFTSGTKTAVFVTDRGTQTREFTGYECVIPEMITADGARLYVGLTEGSLQTTSRAVIVLVDSITTNAGPSVDPAVPDTPIADNLSLNDRVAVNIVSSGEVKSASLEQVLGLVPDISLADIANIIDNR